MVVALVAAAIRPVDGPTGGGAIPLGEPCGERSGELDAGGLVQLCRQCNLHVAADPRVPALLGCFNGCREFAGGSETAAGQSVRGYVGTLRPAREVVALAGALAGEREAAPVGHGGSHAVALRPRVRADCDMANRHRRLLPWAVGCGPERNRRTGDAVRPAAGVSGAKPLTAMQTGVAARKGATSWQFA